MYSREFLGGVLGVGAAQFLWTLLRVVVWPDPAAWMLGTIRGIVLAAISVIVTGAYLLATRPDETPSRTAFFRFLGGSYVGMTAALLLLGPGGGILGTVLFGFGLLLPPVAVGTTAGEVLRRVRGARKRRG